MVLTAKQEEGLRIAVERHNNGEKYTVISGYAGTGKSTLVRFIIAALNVNEDRVCYATFTGKAAEVLRKKGNKNATTMHKLLYDFVPRRGGGFFRKPKPMINYDIVVIDEVSMAPKEMMDLLFKHNVYVICLGDPFQIPPIDKDADNHLLDNPHIFLDEIMRQAQESEIVRLSMNIREMKPIELFKGTNVQVVGKNQLIPGMLTWADQVIVATNNKRHQLNNQMRQMLGFNGPPQAGDKIICLHNYWNEASAYGDALVNGTIGYLAAPEEHTITLPAAAHCSVPSIQVYNASMTTGEDDIYEDLMMDKRMLIEGEATLDWRDVYTLGRMVNRYGDLIPKQFSYGYAITGHKAQGSEWDKVLVIEESFPFDRIEHARWLYTCVTRAADKLVLVRNT